MKYSIILLDFDPENKRVLERGECKRLIHEHSQGEDYELLIADQEGLQKSENETVKKAQGEYIVFICNDVMIHDDKWLSKLCKPGAITSWAWTQFHLTGEPELEFSCYGLPRYVYERLGGFDERFADGYGYDDNDLLLRSRDAGYLNRVANVRLDHGEAQTFKAYFTNEERAAKQKKNYDLFIEKWKEHPQIKKYLLSS